MRVGIVGGGAVGLSLGSFLLAAGASVRFAVRNPDDRQRLAHQGLTRGGLFGSAHHAPDRFELAASVEELRGDPIDFLLVCSKTTSSRAVAEALADIWSDFPVAPAVVLCQNGWGNAELFRAHIEAAHIFNARVITGFRRNTPNSVEITVHAEPIHLGSLHGAPAERLAPLRDGLARAGMPCELSDAISRDLWAKMLYNCALNPLGALLGVPYGELAKRPASREVLNAVIHEIFQVLGPAGYTTHWSSAADYQQVFYEVLLPPTEAHESSMLQDIRNDRPSEVDALCGAVVRLGKKHKINTPVNQALTELIHALEEK